MAAPKVDISHGITIQFLTSGFTAQILDVTPPALTRKSINTSHQGTSTAETFLPGDLHDPGELVYDIHWLPGQSPPINQPPEQIRINYPGGGSQLFVGFLTNCAPRAPHEDKMTATVTVKVSGQISDTAPTTSSTSSSSTTTTPP